MAPLPHSNTGPFLPYILVLLQASTWGCCVHSLFLYSDTPPPHPSSIQLAQISFEVNLYLHKYPSNLISFIVLFHKYYEDGVDSVF